MKLRTSKILASAAAVLAATSFSIATAQTLTSGLSTAPVDPTVSPAPNAPAPQRKEGGGTSPYCERQLGTWFYCEAPQEDTEPTQDPTKEISSQKAQDDADVAAAEKFKADMERARQIAVWNPTEPNLRRYYAFQAQTLEKSGVFADSIRRIVWSDPSLDYTLKRPISNAGKSDWQQTRDTDRDLFFRGAYDQIGLFYIFKGSCAPCRTASPIVAAFGHRYGFPVKAISTDGAPNPEFADVRKDMGQLASWGITEPVTPAYLIYQNPTLADDGSPKAFVVTVSDGKKITLRPCLNPKGCITYLGAGVLTVDELADRLFVTLATEPGKDF